MVYNPPDTGHVVLILDNGTTAMTGAQEHPGTGRNLLHDATGRVVFEEVARAMGIPRVRVIDPMADEDAWKRPSPTHSTAVSSPSSSRAGPVSSPRQDQEYERAIAEKRAAECAACEAE